MKVDAPYRVVELVQRYDQLVEEIYDVRKAFTHLSKVLINLVTVRFRPDAPPGYGTTWDMSDAQLPDLKELGDKIFEWQTIRSQMIKLLADPSTDEKSCLYLDSKLHVRVGAC